MEYLQVDDKIRLERIHILLAPTIFSAIEANRSFLRRWLPFVDQTRKLSDTEHFIKLIINAPETDDVYSIFYDGEFAGLIAYKDSDKLNHKTEIGYWLIERMQGKGIMTKSVSKLVDFAFRNLAMNRVQIKVAVGNKKSAAIPKRLGFEMEGIERDGERHNNHYLDLEIYSFLKKDWVNLILKTF